MIETVPVTAMVTAFSRIDATIKTLQALRQSAPAPAEVIVHVDGGATDLSAAVQHAFPTARVLVSRDRVGPGGARNLMVAAATHPIVASFDDDSAPIDPDFFARVIDVFEQFPDAWVVGAQIFHQREPIAAAARVAEWVADFTGCGCAYKRERYVDVGGYVPLIDAYNMEEVDFALRLHAKGGRVLATQWLRVFHDTDLARHADPGVTAASIANLALLAFLRYPVRLWTIGVAQCANRIQWLMRNGRRRGILAGLADIPRRVWTHRGRRDPLPASAVRSYFSLRRHPVPAPLDPAIARAHG